MTPHCVQRFAPAVPNTCQLCPYNWQSCAERSIVMYAIWGLSVFCACSMRISSSRRLCMDSSAFHELTAAAIRGILPLDLSLSWQHKAAQTAVVLPLCNDDKRDRYLGCWYCVCCKPKQCSTSEEEGRSKRSDSRLGAFCLHRHDSFLMLCRLFNSME